MTSKLSLRFRKTPDEMPADSEDIFFLDVSSFYGSFDIQSGRVEYSWYDPDNWGDQCEEEVSGWKKVLQLGSRVIPDGTLWCPAADVEKLIDEDQP